jgi:hypothetical protein
MQSLVPPPVNMPHVVVEKKRRNKFPRATVASSHTTSQCRKPKLNTTDYWEESRCCGKSLLCTEKAHSLVGAVTVNPQFFYFDEPDEDHGNNCGGDVPSVNCERCTFENPRPMAHTHGTCAMCGHSLNSCAEDSVSSNESPEPEWDLVDEGHVEDGDSDAGSNASAEWESLPSPSCWASVVRSTTQDDTQSQPNHLRRVENKSRALTSQSSGGALKKSTANERGEVLEVWSADADETYALFVGDTDFAKRTRRTKQSAASRLKRLKHKGDKKALVAEELQ